MKRMIRYDLAGLEVLNSQLSMPPSAVFRQAALYKGMLSMWFEIDEMPQAVDYYSGRESQEPTTKTRSYRTFCIIHDGGHIPQGCQYMASIREDDRGPTMHHLYEFVS